MSSEAVTIIDAIMTIVNASTMANYLQSVTKFDDEDILEDSGLFPYVNFDISDFRVEEPPGMNLKHMERRVYPLQIKFGVRNVIKSKIKTGPTATSKGTATMTIAAPGVVTNTGHGLLTGDCIYFSTTGALPAGIIASTNYYVIYINANTFYIASTYALAQAGTKITTTGSQSGTHTLWYNPDINFKGLFDIYDDFRVLINSDRTFGDVVTNAPWRPVFGSDVQKHISGEFWIGRAIIILEVYKDVFII